MSRSTRCFVCVMILAAFAVLPARTAPDESNTPPRSAALVSRRAGSSSSGVLTDDQIANLKTEWTDPKTGKTFQFNSSFVAGKVDPKDYRKYAKSGRVPFRITATFSEIKESNGKKTYERQTGNCRILVLDAEGNQIAKKSESLDSMCST